jgi:predicted metal-dependent hydrolase
MSRVLHPVLTPDERRRLLWQGVDCFNRGEHFEAHEEWEEVWRSNLPEPRTLLQGLIQVAADMHQILDLHRTAGPRKTLAKAAANLEPYAPTALGLDVAGVLASVEQWRAWLAAGGETPPLPELRVVDREAVE